MHINFTAVAAFVHAKFGPSYLPLFCVTCLKLSICTCIFPKCVVDTFKKSLVKAFCLNVDLAELLLM